MSTVPATSATLVGFSSGRDKYLKLVSDREESTQAARIQEAIARSKEVSSGTKLAQSQITAELKKRFPGNCSAEQSGDISVAAPVVTSAAETTPSINASPISTVEPVNARVAQIAHQNDLACLNRFIVASLVGLAALPCIYFLKQAYAECRNEDLEVANCKRALSDAAFALISAPFVIKYLCK